METKGTEQKKSKMGFILPMLAFMQNVFNSRQNKVQPLSPSFVNKLRSDAVMGKNKIAYYTHFYDSLPLKRVRGKWRVKR